MGKALPLALVLGIAGCGRGEGPAAAPGPGADLARGAVVRLPVGPGPAPVALVDLNLDGHLDLVVGMEGNGEASVLLGDGRGGFRLAPGSPFPAGPMPTDFALGDFDQDGRTDLAVANHETSFATVLLGDGSGRFVPSPRSPFFTGSRPHVHSVAAGDLTGDGTLDLVVESADTDSVQVVAGDGRGGFSAPVPYAVPFPYFRVRIADVDGDGRPDVVAPAHRLGAVAVLRSDGRGGLVPTPGSPFAVAPSPLSVAIGDLNGDHRADLAVVHIGDSRVSLLVGGPGGFAPALRVRAGIDPTNLAIGDVNGDGVLDLAVSNYTSDDVTLFVSGPAGPAAVTLTVRVGRRPQELALGDLDHDGRADMVVADFLDGDVAIWLSR